MDLLATEIRVLGCLLEKQRTTPDAYPLSLNALRSACNQATNRDPVVDYDEATVRDALHRLGRRRLTRLAGGGRAAKYRLLLDEALPMGREEEAIMCVLMLRGPQTPGELKQRAERIHWFPSLEAVVATLERLIDRGLVARLERRPGQKEERYRERLGEDAAVGGVGGEAGAAAGDGRTVGAGGGAALATAGDLAGAGVEAGGAGAAVAPSTETTAAGAIGGGLEARVGRLERAVDELRDERVAGLERAIAELRDERVAGLERAIAELRDALGG